MASNKYQKQAFYHMKNEDLETFLKEHALEVPMRESGGLDRGAAIRACENWEVASGYREGKEKFVRLTINEQDGPNGGPYVFVGINERSFYIPRNLEVVVPESVVNVLNDAVQIKTVAERQQDGSFRYYDTPIRRFSYVVHGYVEQEKEADA